MISDAKLDFWIKTQLNVLFIGKHGVGKTTIITKAFDEHNLKWMYFSASTMDPWVDFIGVPKEQKDSNGTPFLDLVRPKAFQDDEVEALFFDEYNRAPKKVRNAVMELIQFKSINGKKFKNLKIVWAAINPDDEEDDKYDVEKLDPAQKDRFHVHCFMPYKPDYAYFKQKYGETWADSAMAWWKDLPEEMKNLVSPRRLDYALDILKKGGDLRDALPSKSNISKLLHELDNGSVRRTLKDFFGKKNKDEAKQWLAQENNYNMCIEYVIKHKPYLQYFLPLLSDEKISNLLSTNETVKKCCFDNPKAYAKVMQDIVNANLNKSLAKKVKRVLEANHLLVVPTVASNDGNVKADNPSIASLLSRFYTTSTFQNTNQRSNIMTNLIEEVKGKKRMASTTDADAALVLGAFNVYCKKSHQRIAENLIKYTSNGSRVIQGLIAKVYGGQFNIPTKDFDNKTLYILTDIVYKMPADGTNGKLYNSSSIMDTIQQINEIVRGESLDDSGDDHPDVHEDINVASKNGKTLPAPSSQPH